jgi:hypothetical protein
MVLLGTPASAPVCSAPRSMPARARSFGAGALVADAWLARTRATRSVAALMQRNRLIASARIPLPLVVDGEQAVNVACGAHAPGQAGRD